MPLSFELDNAQKEYLGRQATLAIQSVSWTATVMPRPQSHASYNQGVRGKP